MSDNTILSRFCKCGDLNKYSRRFHLLERSQKERALEAIRNGIEPDKAIRRAKRGN